MSNELEPGIRKLVETIAVHPSVRAIGLSGGEWPFPKPGEGDIDLFVYCNEIPDGRERREMLRPLQNETGPVDIAAIANGHWGQGDRSWIAGVETWLLYFTIAEARAELEAILGGQYLGRSDIYYYPMGRCAMWKSLRTLYDPDGVLESFKRHLEEYPAQLASAVIQHHLEALEDVEDLERAVARKDLLFFHFALDIGLDHFLQAVFALNKEYFPSRKRSEAYLAGFEIKPPDCEGRLRQVVALGGNADTLDQAYQIWDHLVHDLELLAENDSEGVAGSVSRRNKEREKL